jgi:DNA (cytosine-5)-methyltransferase 1
VSATVLDLFCGCGGSTKGMQQAGMYVIHASNHNKLAVEVHGLNHPETEHSCADISRTDPRHYPTTDVLWASPECTNHSVAKGVRRATGQADIFGEDGPDPSAERSRATMWDVPRFVEAMLMRGRPYRAVIVENVVDAVRWMYWPAWLAAMDAAGYDHHVVYLNSAFAHGKNYGWLGAPQYRDRIYVVFWRKGATAPDLDVRPPGWCPTCEARVDAVQSWKRPFEQHWGRYRAQYTYHCPACRGEVEPFALPAATAINWTDLGGLIGDRNRPLAAATRERIRAGLARYGRPVGVPVGGNTFERIPDSRVRPPNRPVPVRTTTASDAFVTPPMLVPAGGTWNDGPRPVDVPMRVRTTRETDGIVCPPTVVPVEARDGSRARPASEPVRTRTTRLENSVVVPEAFLAVLRQNVRATSTADPLTTVSANGNHQGLVVPSGFVIRNNNSGGRGDVARTCTPFDQPTRVVTTTGHQSLVTVPDSVLVPYYGNGVARHVRYPASTVTTKDRHALVTRAPGDVPDTEVDGCTFRMLEPAEILAAMAFPDTYLMRGTKRDRVRMAGNAVTPPAARLVAERVLAALAADR